MLKTHVDLQYLFLSSQNDSSSKPKENEKDVMFPPHQGEKMERKLCSLKLTT